MPTDHSARPSSPAAAAARRRRIRRMLTRALTGAGLSRRTRWIVRVALGVPLLLLLLAALALHSPLVEYLVAGRVESLLNCRFQCRYAVLHADGRLVIKDMSLRVPHLDGPAGEFLSARRAEVDLDLAGLLTGSVRPTALRLYQPVFRVSQSTTDGSINIAALAGASSTSALPQPPRIDAIDGAIELGEHTPTAYSVLATLPVTGALSPIDPAKPDYTVVLQQITRSPAGSRRPEDRGMLLDGRLDLQAGIVAVRLVNINLDAWPASSVPSSIRDLWRRLNIQGRIDQVTVDYAPTTGLRTDISVADVSMDALIPADLPGTAPDAPLALRHVAGSISLTPAGLTARLRGLIGDQVVPSQIVLTTQGLALDSPLRCEIITERFSVSKNPRLLPYAPEIVRERFETFSGPTAEVDARVEITRGPATPAGPAPLHVSGSLIAQNGTAAFEGFPYPIADLSGRVEFSDDRIDIVSVHGRGPTGAILSAHGTIAPLDDTSEVKISILILDVPLDENLRLALKPHRRPIIDFLFDKPHYQRLLDDGLILPTGARAQIEQDLDAARLEQRRLAAQPAPDPVQAAQGAQRIADLERRLQRPDFALGGTAQINVEVHRALGLESDWTQDITFACKSIGLLPRVWPMPIVGSDVVLHIDDAEAQLKAGTFAGLRAGSASIDARVILETDGRSDMRPFVKVRATGFPVDDLLLHALPDDSPPVAARLVGPPAPDAETATRPFSAAAILHTLDITGTVDCKATVNPTPDGDVAYDALVDLHDLRAAPVASATPPDPAAPPPLALAGLSGRLRVTNDHLSIPSLTGRLEPADSANPPDTVARLTLSLDADFTNRQDGPALDAQVNVADIELAAPIEPIVGMFSPAAADSLVALRTKYRPVGRVDALVSLHQPPGDPVRVDARVSAAHTLAFDAFGGRISLEHPTGALLVRAGSDRSLTFSDAGAGVAFDNQPAATLHLDGTLPLDPSPSKTPSAVTTTVRDAHLESGLVRALLKLALSPRTQQAVTTANPRGLFDADLIISAAPTPPGPPSVLVGSTSDTSSPADSLHLSVAGDLSPRSLTFNADKTEVAFPVITGRLHLDPPSGAGANGASGSGGQGGSGGGGGGGRIDHLTAQSDHFRIAADGSWRSDPHASGGGAGGAGSVNLDAIVSLEAITLDPQLRALLPASVASALDALHFTLSPPAPQADGAAPPTVAPISLPDARLSLTFAQDPAAGAASFTGVLSFVNAALDIGLPITGCQGTLAIDVEQAPAAPPVIDLSLLAPRLSLAGVPMTNARARAVTGSEPGRIILPLVSADCHGGRVSASAVLRISPSSPTAVTYDAPEYQADINLAGLPFNQLLSEFSLGAPTSGAPAATPPAVAAAAGAGAGATHARAGAPQDESRGLLDASLSLTGFMGNPASRRGRGSVRIAGGDIIRLPLVMPLMQLSNLQLPSGDRLDYLQSTFDVLGERVRFEQVTFLSRTISIVGTGDMILPDTTLDLRFNSKSTRRVPVWSDLMEALRDELITTHVTGTLAQPHLGAEPLSLTRRVLGSIIGPGDQAGGPFGPETERAARQEQQRLRQTPQLPARAPDP